MARIAGVNLPNDKRIEIALTAILGIGRNTGLKAVVATGIDRAKRAKDLTEAEVKQLTEFVEQQSVEGDLRREVSANIKRLKDAGTYRGVRHERKLPARGQRTKTNARTKRGKRVTVGSGRSKAAAKT
ncbi:MAG TPA: 30S ribosomal protein S13 [Patescibacteria group bacterium]|jgi:small subunit ribosomal protein S13